MADEREWTGDKARFVADARRVAENHPTPAGDDSPLSSPLVEQFTQLTRSLLDAQTVGEALERILIACTKAIPGVDVASVTLRSPDGTFHTPTETDEIAYELDQVQYATGEGPCVDARKAARTRAGLQRRPRQRPRLAPVRPGRRRARACTGRCCRPPCCPTRGRLSSPAR